VKLRATISERSTRTLAGGIAQGVWTGTCSGKTQQWHLTATRHQRHHPQSGVRAGRRAGGLPPLRRDDRHQAVAANDHPHQHGSSDWRQGMLEAKARTASHRPTDQPPNRKPRPAFRFRGSSQPSRNEGGRCGQAKNDRERSCLRNYRNTVSNGHGLAVLVAANTVGASLNRRSRGGGSRSRSPQCVDV
jgi:hypothetical protein